MARKDFLKQIWQRLCKPLLFLIVLYYCVFFLISVLFLDNSPERMFTILILSITALSLLLYTGGSLFTGIIEKVYLKLPDKTKSTLRILKKISDYLAVLLLGALLYRFWSKDAIEVLIVIVILVINRIRIIITEQKTPLFKLQNPNNT